MFLPPKHWQAFATKFSISEKPSTTCRDRSTDTSLPWKKFKRCCTPKSTRLTKCRTFWRPSRGSPMRCCSQFSRRQWRARIRGRNNVQSLPSPRSPVDGETSRFILLDYGGACASPHASHRACWSFTKQERREHSISKSGGGETGEIFSASTVRSK